MATDQLITAAVDRALATARVEPDGLVLFEPEALAAVVRLCDSGHGLERVLAAVDRALVRAVEGLAHDRSLAAMTLVHRIEAGTTQHRVVVENLQGDVGTGLGPPEA